MVRKESGGWKRDFRVKILDSKQFLKVVCVFNSLDQQKGRWNGGQDSSESGNQKVVDFTIWSAHLKPENTQIKHLNNILWLCSNLKES